MKINLVRIVEFKENSSLHPRDVIPSFELLNIASLLKKDGHQIKYFDNEILSLDSLEFKRLLFSNKADIYIFHFQPIVAKEISKIIKIIRNKTKKTTIAFGPTVEYRTLLFLKKSFVDFAILGEAELTVQEIVNKITIKNSKLNLYELEKIKGIAYLYKNKFIKNLPRELLNPNDLPFMAHELVQNYKYKVVSKIIKPKNKIKWGFLLSSRGCPFNCTFCSPSIRYSFGKNYRYQSPKRTVDEIEYMIMKFSINAISFEDDIFTLNKKRVLSICKEIIKRKIKISWTVATRLDCLNLKMINLMKKAGFQGISTGIESGSDRILKIVEKGENTKTIEKGIKMLQKVGIAVTANIIIGHPTETKEDLKSTLNLINKVKPAFIHLHYLTPYLGAKLFLDYINNHNEFNTYTHRKNHEFNISSIRTQELNKTFKKIYFSHYISFSFFKNYIKYRLNYLLFDPLFELSFLFKTLTYFLSIKNL